mmetsp:Transcript_63630/g.136774  ORF Transcript_63630/g.136774 Transcript_63630/m.136774 type:complete len:117 (-) Transcript_63630:3002-3352(-)
MSCPAVFNCGELEGHVEVPADCLGEVGEAGPRFGEPGAVKRFGVPGEFDKRFGVSGEADKRFGVSGEPDGRFGESGEPGAGFEPVAGFGGSAKCFGMSVGCFGESGGCFGESTCLS